MYKYIMDYKIDAMIRYATVLKAENDQIWAPHEIIYEEFVLLLSKSQHESAEIALNIYLLYKKVFTETRNIISGLVSGS